MTLSSKERIGRILKHQPVDRIGLFEVYWRETAQKWAAEGHFAAPGDVSDHFGLDLRRTGGEITPANYNVVNLIADVDAREEIVEETETVKLTRNGNGALLRWNKQVSGAPEHVGFAVHDRRSWEEYVRPHLVDESTYERRLDFAAYRSLRTKCIAEELFMAGGVVGPFDQMSPLCGHENLLLGMGLDGEWVQEMADLYATVAVRLLEILWGARGCPMRCGSGKTWVSSSVPSCRRPCTRRRFSRPTRSSLHLLTVTACRSSCTATDLWRH